MRHAPPATVLLVLFGLALAGIVASLMIGSVTLTPAEAWHGLLADDTSLARSLVRDLRLPRAMAAFATGGVLALAGVLMQVLLRNPLADPYIMGVSGGAAVAALTGLLLGLHGIAVDTTALVGALLVTFTVFAIAHGPGGWTPARLLLTGIVIASGCAAIVSLLLALGEDSSLRGMLFWLMGDLSFSSRPWPLLALLGIATLLGLAFARHLNILARGETQARILGLAVVEFRVCLFIAASLLTAASVTAAGTIGFVGLVTPHLVRLVLGADHRRVVPAAALLGGALVVMADLVARTAFAPRQLPVGALTALVGVPLFLVLMRRQ